MSKRQAKRKSVTVATDNKTLCVIYWAAWEQLAKTKGKKRTTLWRAIKKFDKDIFSKMCELGGISR